MKTLKKQIKATMLLLILVLNTNMYAQKTNEKGHMFIRVYGLEGKKISKGKIFVVSDTLLILKRNSKFINLDPKQIGYIKTKRSSGHNVLMGAVIGSTTASVISVASINPDDGFIYDDTPDNFGEALVGGVVVGGIVGSAIGAITIPFKNSKTFIINGDISKWKTFEQMFN